MKKLFFLLLFAISFLKINAQKIEATTTAGKKVILNLDNKTWDYANPEDGQKSCYTNHKGSVHFFNKSTQSVYVYYGKANVDGIEYVKINSGDSALVDNIYTGNPKKSIDYKWTVSYEFYKDINKYRGYSNAYNKVGDIKGFNAGGFTLDDCETEIVYIKD